MDEGDVALATDLSAAALAEARQTKAPLLEAWALCLAATSNASIGLCQEALDFGIEALDVACALKNITLEARALFAISFVAMESKDVVRAQDVLERSLACALEAESDVDAFWALNNLSHIHGEYAEAHAASGDDAGLETALDELKRHATKALEVARRTQNWLHRCYALLNLASAEFISGKFDEAHSLIARYSRLARANNDIRLMAYANLDEARLLARTGQLAQAISTIIDPVHLRDLCQTDDLRLRSHDSLAQMFKTQGAYEQAVAHLEIARAIERDMQAALINRHIGALTARLQVEEAQAEAKRLQVEAIALEVRNEILERDRAELERNAMLDALTGLGNRRAADEAIALRVQTALETQRAFSLAYVDIDNFKMINDRFGHKTGDDVLVAIAGLLANNMRAQDPVFRFGGEEFVILIGDRQTMTSQQVCERLRGVIAKHDWCKLNPDLKVTASFGVSRWQGESKIDAVIARADAALYAAKDAGRNRVVRG